jgi:hypothetical protein
MVLRHSLLVFSSVTVLMLGACSSNSSTNSTAANPPDATASPASTTKQKSTDAKDSHVDDEKGHNHDHGKEGDHSGQVIETGQYHLEFIPSKESDGTHLDFVLQKGEAHEPVPNAKVTAQVQFPDGTQKTLNLKYEPDAKHYGAKLPSQLPGDYKVVILSDINGQKVNGRFAFKQ